MTLKCAQSFAETFIQKQKQKQKAQPITCAGINLPELWQGPEGGC